MKVKYLFFAGLVSMMAWSCSDDELQGGGNDKPTDAKTYMEISINMPAATRTATPNQGQEEGQEFENYVGSVLILAVEAEEKAGKLIEDNLVFAKKVEYDGINTPATSDVSHVLINDVTGMDVKRTGVGDTKGYTIYAFVNPTNNMVEYYTQLVGTTTAWATAKEYRMGSQSEKENVNKFIEELTADGYADHFNNSSQVSLNQGHFLMTDTRMENVGTGAEEQPKEKVIYYFTPGMLPGSHVLKASTNVERAVARFDYKDNVAYTLSKNANSTEQPDGGAELIIKLTDYCVMNVAKDFYYLKRVTENADKGSAANWIYGGAELKTNYVVDADWTAKNGLVNGDWSDETAKGLFYTPLNGDATNNYIPLNRTLFEDNWDGDNDTNRGDYKALCYCTENTIFGVDNQIHGLTTAIVFKAEVTGDFVKGAPSEEGKKALYRYSNTIYNSWEAVKNVAGCTDVDYDAYYKAFQLSDKDPYKKPDITKWDIEGTNDDAKAICYYTYWNRHNDNGNNNRMGIMEFAVVRNNIYKLFVKSILRLGEPTDPTNPGEEGNKEPPTEPDESEKISMEVDVKVLNWAVRKNDITFD